MPEVWLTGQGSDSCGSRIMSLWKGYFLLMKRLSPVSSSVFSSATLICTCWETMGNHQFYWASTLSFVRKRLNYARNICSFTVSLDIPPTFGISNWHFPHRGFVKLRVWFARGQYVNEQLTDWSKLEESKLACQCYISHLFSHFFRAI